MIESSPHVRSSVAAAHRQALPSPEFRTVASFLLFAYLFALAFVTLRSTTAFPSELVRRVRAVVCTPLMYVGLDHPHDYSLVTGDPTGYDHFLEADVNLVGGEVTKVRLGEDAQWPIERRQRYVAMANYVGMPVHNELSLDEARLPTVIGAGLLRLHPGADNVVLRAKLYNPQDGASTRSSDPGQRDPRSQLYQETIYTGRVRLIDGEPQVSKIGAASTVAPPTRRTGTDTGRRTPAAGATPNASPLPRSIVPQLPPTKFRQD